MHVLLRLMYGLSHLLLFSMGLVAFALVGLVSALFAFGPERRAKDPRDTQMSSPMDGREAVLVIGALVGASVFVLVWGGLVFL